MLCLDYDFFLCACDSGEFLCEFEFEVIILVFSLLRVVIANKNNV